MTTASYTDMRAGRASDVHHLNKLLRGELSAAESYRIALCSVLFSPSVTDELTLCRESHAQRAALLCDLIEEVGGMPVKTSGAWGAFAATVESSAAGLGPNAALVVLSEGEAHGLRSYQRHLPTLRSESYSFVTRSLFPMQQETTTAVVRLRLAQH